jgi:hypothetical protein
MFIPPTEIEAFSDGYLDSSLYPVSSFDEAGGGVPQTILDSHSSDSEYRGMKLERLSLGSAVSSLQLSDSNEVEVEPLTVSRHRDQAPPIPRRATKHKNNWSSSSNMTTTARGDANSQADNSNAALVDRTAQRSLENSGINLNDSTETHVHTDYAPAVTKDLVRPTMHEIRQEQITREIHNHDVFHRILPIKQTEILPARHFYRNSTGQVSEIGAKDVPNGSETVISVHHVTEYEDSAFVPRQFTASTLEGFHQDYESRLDADGICRSHTTWIHAPVLQEGGLATGQTTAFHFQTRDAANAESLRIPNERHDM